MLDNTKIFETAENKELDTLLKKYNDFKVQIKDMQESQKKCADRIKELCNKTGGKYETLNFVFTLIEQAGKSSINVEKLRNKHEDVWESLPSECISVKVTELKKNKDIWANFPTECIDVASPVLSMGDITPKTSI